MLLHGLNVNIVAEKELSRVYFVRSAAAICGQKHISYIYFFIELKHLKHFFSMFQLMAQFLCSNHFALENATMHFKFHLRFFEVLPFKIVFRFFL